MIKYLKKPMPITAEQEKEIKRVAHENANKQKKNPTEVFWWLKQPHTTKEEQNG